MSRPCRAPRVDQDERGFVLVGVVIFVLALTILGLSLFSLSSYEAQFLTRSADDAQAYQTAMGGLTRAKMALAADVGGNGPHLENVKLSMPADVDSTVAWQWLGGTQTFAGPVQMDSTVWVRVRAHEGQSSRAVMARFIPNPSGSWYKALIHAADPVRGVFVDTLSGSGATAIHRSQTLRLGDRAVTTSSDISWLARLQLAPVWEQLAVPVPSATAFIAAHIAGATSLEPGPTYDLTSGADDQVRFFTSPDGHAGDYGLDELAQANIRVSGPVVWLLPRGMRLQNGAIFGRSGGAGPHTALIIVAAPGYEPEDSLGGMHIGFVSKSGMTSTDVPIFLVSDGAAEYDQENSYPNSFSVYYLSIFARGVYLRGPQHLPAWPMPSLVTTTLYHDSGGAEDQVGGLVDWLGSHGALPDFNGGSNVDYTMVAGSWVEDPR